MSLLKKRALKALWRVRYEHSQRGLDLIKSSVKTVAKAANGEVTDPLIEYELSFWLLAYQFTGKMEWAQLEQLLKESLQACPIMIAYHDTASYWPGYWSGSQGQQTVVDEKWGHVTLQNVITVSGLPTYKHSFILQTTGHWPAPQAVGL